MHQPSSFITNDRYHSTFDEVKFVKPMWMYVRMFVCTDEMKHDYKNAV